MIAILPAEASSGNWVCEYKPIPVAKATPKMHPSRAANNVTMVTTMMSPKVGSTFFRSVKERSLLWLVVVWFWTTKRDRHCHQR